MIQALQVSSFRAFKVGQEETNPAAVLLITDQQHRELSVNGMKLAPVYSPFC